MIAHIETIPALQKEVHEVAKSKGWYDMPRTFGENMALLHTELSEALWSFDDKETSYYTQAVSGKPDGWGVELADFIIRVLDVFEVERIDSGFGEKTLKELQGTIHHPVTFASAILETHSAVDRAFEAWRESGDWVSHLNIAFMHTLILAQFHGLNMTNLVRVKIEYNKTRPYRHGGKRA